MSDTDEDEELDEAPPEDIGDDDEDEGGGRRKGGRRRKLILFVGIPLVVIILAAAGAIFSGILPLGGGDEEEAAMEEEHGGEGGDSEHAEEGGEHGEGGEGGPGHSGFLEIPQQTVNLNTTDGTTAFLRFAVQLELANDTPENRAAVEANMPRVLDNLQVYMRELRVDEVQGSSGMFRLKQELLMRINRAVDPVRVSDILFTEMLVQ